MVDQVSGLASGATGGSSFAILTGALQGGISTLINHGKSILDRFFPPEKREALYAMLSKFATEKPMLASFLLSQIALSGIPLALFAVMTIGLLVFALVAGLVIAVVGALLFTVFCVGIALLVLLPTLFVTTFAGAFVWLWAVGAYYLLKWFNEKDIPGIHTGLADGLVEQSGIMDLVPDLNSTANGDTKGRREYDMGDGRAERGEKRPEQPPKKAGEKKEITSPTREKTPTVGKTTGASVLNVGDMKRNADLGNVNKTLDGVKGSLPGGVV